MSVIRVIVKHCYSTLDVTGLLPITFPVCELAKSLQLCPTCCNPMNHSLPGSSSMGFSSQQHWNGLPFPSPGDLPNPGIKLASLASPALAGSFFTTSATWESQSAPLPILITSSYYIRHLNNIPSDINLTGDFAFSVKNLKNKNTSEAKRIFGNDDFSKKKKEFSSVAQSCPTLCNPTNRSTPCLPVHHQLPESTQNHVHWVGDAIQPSHPLLSPSPPAPNLSQHQGFYK